jgi:tRNA (uracil-5-)-methyltransferase TRM9
VTVAAHVWPGTILVRRSYASLATHYSTMTLSYQSYPGLRQELAAFLTKVPAGPVLDLGCGAGRDAQMAAQTGRSVILADVTPELLSAAGRLTSQSAVCCDALALPFRSAGFAGIIASGVLLHLPKPYTVAALEGIRRILIPGGKALVSMKHGGHDGWRTTDNFPEPRWFTYYEPDDFARVCEQAGLRVTHMEKNPRKDWFTATTQRPAAVRPLARAMPHGTNRNGRAKKR